jgi:kynurenine formamidase
MMGESEENRMCNAGVIESVKADMLSRRKLFASAAAFAAAGSGLSGALAPKAMAQGHTGIQDMTHELSTDFPTFTGEQQFWLEPHYDFLKDGYNLNYLRFDEHTGTHIDAPLHFSADGRSVAEIPVGDLVVPLCVVDIRQRAAENADTQLTPDDLLEWTGRHGPLPQKACVAMLSGWQIHSESTKFRNTGSDGQMHFPGFHLETVQMLLETDAAGIAVDTLSLDPGNSQDFPVHAAWLPQGRWGLEAIANLDQVPQAGATLVVGAPKHRGGSGGPARVFAMI